MKVDKELFMEQNGQCCKNCGWANKSLEHNEILNSRSWTCDCPKNIYQKYNLVVGEYYPAKRFSACAHNVGTDYCEWVKICE